MWGSAFVISSGNKLHPSIDVRHPSKVTPSNENFQFYASFRRQMEFLLHT